MNIDNFDQIGKLLRCSYCEEIISIDWTVWIYDEPYCQECIDEMKSKKEIVECFHCNEFIHRECAKWNDGEPYCQECFDDMFYNCYYLGK